MLDAWISDERTVNYNKQPVFRPTTINTQPLQPKSNDQKEYLWLLSGIKPR